jgi:hypothetical protein
MPLSVNDYLRVASAVLIVATVARDDSLQSSVYRPGGAELRFS